MVVDGLNFALEEYQEGVAFNSCEVKQVIQRFKELLNCEEKDLGVSRIRVNVAGVVGSTISMKSSFE